MSGHQSEPTTPPEYRDSVFPTQFSRPNRYSASMTSPTGLGSFSTRASRSGSQAVPNFQQQSVSHVPSKSVPGTRRNSDEEEEEEFEYEYNLPETNTRSAAL